MALIEVTDRELEMLRIAVETMTQRSGQDVNTAPTEEDEIAENAFYVECKSLQIKFPPLDGIFLVNRGE